MDQQLKPIGTIFDHNNINYVVVGFVSCKSCAFGCKGFCDRPKVAGFCSKIFREDKKDIMYKIENQITIKF
jgi:hypothetical protein